MDIDTLARGAVFGGMILLLILAFRVLRWLWRAVARGAGAVKSGDAMRAAGYVAGKAERKASSIAEAFREGRDVGRK